MKPSKLAIIVSVIFVLSFSFFFHLDAQDIVIKGSVVDSLSNEPVPFATVFLNPGTATIADEQGNFSLPLKTVRKDDTLKISCVGYSNRQIPLDQILPAQINIIRLNKAVFEINPVEINAKAHRIPDSEKIIRAAISWIPRIFPADPVLYKGYYREYLKRREQFC